MPPKNPEIQVTEAIAAKVVTKSNWQSKRRALRSSLSHRLQITACRARAIICHEAAQPNHLPRWSYPQLGSQASHVYLQSHHLWWRRRRLTSHNHQLLKIKWHKTTCPSQVIPPKQRQQLRRYCLKWDNHLPQDKLLQFCPHKGSHHLTGGISHQLKGSRNYRIVNHHLQDTSHPLQGSRHPLQGSSHRRWRKRCKPRNRSKMSAQGTKLFMTS